MDSLVAREKVDLVAVVRMYTNLDRGLRGSCPFCGGRDRFFVMAGRDRCGCRKCEPGRVKTWDAFSLVAQLKGISSTEAAQELLGMPSLQAEPRKSESRPEPWSDPLWQAETHAAVRAGYLELTGERGTVGREYLLARGLNHSTWKRFRLGYCARQFDASSETERPTVLVPWLDQAGIYGALKHRFVDRASALDSASRFCQKTGSRPLLFGLQTLACRSTLAVLEGEFNAMTCWQCASDIVDVVSIGAQKSGDSWDALKALVAKLEYKSVVIWVDERAIAGALSALVMSAGASPVFAKPPGKMDANEVLVRVNVDRVRAAIASSLPDGFADFAAKNARACAQGEAAEGHG